MSELASRIRRAVRAEPAPMGFGAAVRQPTPSMLVLALARSADEAEAAAKVGADAIVFDGVALERAAGARKQASGTPCGLRVEQADSTAVSAAKEAGLDFLLVQPDRTAAAALLDRDLGFVLDLREELTDVQLRTLDAMNIDAIWLGVLDGPLTLRKLMELQRVSGLSRKPLAVVAADAIEASDLEALRAAGVAAVAVEASRKGAVEAMKQAVAALPARSALRAEERVAALVPRAGLAAVAEEEEEEEE